MSDVPLYIEIKNYLLKLLQSSEGSERIPSETSLAIKFNVSRVTVRKAFLELEKKGLIKRYRGKGTFSAESGSLPKKSHDLKKAAFITPNIGTRYASDIIYGAEEYFRQKNVSMSVFLSNNDPKVENALIKDCLTAYDGMLLYPADFEKYSEHILKLSIKKFPVCLVDRGLKLLNLSCVSSDNYAVIHDMVKLFHLRGYKNPLFVPFAEEIATTNEERNKSFTDSMIKYYGNLSKNNILWGATADRDKMATLFENFLIAFPKTDVIMLGSNFRIIEALLIALKNLNIDPSKDIAIAIIDNELPELVSKLGFKPYVIAQDARRIGFEAAKTLFTILKNPETITISVPAKIITPEEY